MKLKNIDLEWEYIQHDPEELPLDHWTSDFEVKVNEISYLYMTFSIMNIVGSDKYEINVSGWSWDTWHELEPTTTLEDAKLACQTYLNQAFSKFIKIILED